VQNSRLGARRSIGIWHSPLPATWLITAPGLPVLISPDNPASGVWADTAYRSKKNEAFLAKGMFTSNIPLAKAAPPSDARTCLARQCEAIGGALRSRARLCRAEAPHGPRSAHHRHRSSPDQDRHGQPGLQHSAARLARVANRARMMLIRL